LIDCCLNDDRVRRLCALKMLQMLMPREVSKTQRGSCELMPDEFENVLLLKPYKPHTSV
jgi:hypothetical protein